MKVAVVTPTIGNPKLVDCLASVDKQTYQDITHYIFIDGKEHVSNVEEMLEGATKVKTVVLEENVGKGWYGHRVFAACSFLDRKSTRLNSSHIPLSRMPSSA